MEHIKLKLSKYYMFLFYLFRNKRKKRVFISTIGKNYSDNGKAVSEELYKLDPSIEIIWEIINSSNLPNYVKAVKGRWAVRKAMAQSKVWITDSSYAWKPQDIFSIAVWHGDRGFKKVLHAAHELDYTIGNTIDLFITGSVYAEKMAKEGFLYHGELLKDGTPRNDKLLNIAKHKSDIQRIRKTIGIEDEYKILLFAPTYRDNLIDKQKVNVNLDKIIEILESGGDRWILLIRSHVCSSGLKVGTINKTIDVSNYEDMADLLLVTDFLITDYSSCICDFILTSRPCVLAQFDRQQYEMESRQFWVDPRDTGFLIANNQNELNEIVKKLSEYDFDAISKKVNHFYGTYESGHAANSLAKRIIKELNK